MKRLLFVAFLVVMSLSAFAGEKYTTADTDIGTLMEDPKAKAILEKHIPETIKNSQFSMAYSFTLSFIQTFDQVGELTDETMAAIDADFTALAEQ